MKKIHLLISALLICASVLAQPNLAVQKAGMLSITGSGGSTVNIGTSNVTYLYNTADTYVFLYNASTKETLAAGLVTTIKHDGVAFTSLEEFKTFMQDNNVAVSSSGGGSGGGGSFDPSGIESRLGALNSTAAGSPTGTFNINQLEKYQAIRQDSVLNRVIQLVTLQNSVLQKLLGTLTVAVSSNVLAANAATAALQTTGNTNTLNTATSVASVDLKTPAQISTAAESSVTIGTSSTSVLAADAAGYFALIQVPSTATASVFIKDDGTAATTTFGSIEIVPGGSYFTPRKIATAINAISSVSTGITVRKSN